MKVLIWIGCFFCMAVVQMIFKDNGIILGGIPTAALFALTWFAIQKLCKKWDNRKKKDISDTHSDEPIVDIKNEPDTEITTPQVVHNRFVSAVLSKTKVFLILTVVSVILLFTSIILNEWTYESFFEGCATVFLIMAIVFGSISLINVSIAKIVPLIKKNRTTSPRIKNGKNNFCKYCGAEIDNDSIFCSCCGKNITKGR